MRSLSSLISIIVILAATLVLIIATVAYILGLVHYSQTSIITIYPDSYINSSDVDFALRTVASIHLHVRVSGSPVRVSQIIISGVDSAITYFYLVEEDMNVGDAYRYTRGVVTSTIKPDKDYWIVASIPNSFGGLPAGVTFHVSIYTENGEVYSVSLKSR